MLNELEINAVLLQAKKAVSNGRCFFGLDFRDIVEEFINLKVGDIEEIWPIVLELLDEIKPKHYVVMQNSPAIAEGKLHCFVWKSRKMKKNMQIRFASSKGIFYYFSLRRKH